MKAVIYARYSSRMQEDNYSLDAQITTCRRLADERGWTVANVYTDEAESAKTTRRPAFQEMLRDAKLGKFEVIIVHKLDRFSRSLLDLLLIARDLQERKVSFISATEQFDFTTPWGWTIMVLLAMLAEWFLGNLRLEVAKGKRARAEVGLHNGQLPAGYLVDYQKDKGDGIPIPDEAEAQGIKLAFETYATGRYSDLDVAGILNEAGYRRQVRGNRPSALYNRDAVRKLLQNRFYLGQVSYKGQWFPGAHEPIVTEEVFERCAQIRARRLNRVGTTTRQEGRIYLLTGIAKCLRCGSPVHGHYQMRNSKRYYVCPEKKRRGNCDQLSIRADEAEDAVAQHLMTLTIPDDWEDRMQRLLVDEMKGHGREDVKQEKDRLKGNLVRIRDLYELGDITRQEYLHKRDYYQLQLDALVPVEVPDYAHAVALLRDFEGNWQAATMQEKREIIQTLVESVNVDADKGPVVRVEIKPEYRRLFAQVYMT